jgi:hypothetical protein
LWVLFLASTLGIGIHPQSLSAQKNPLKLAQEWYSAWSKGKIDLRSPFPTKAPRFLDPRSKRIRETMKARGRFFYWSNETELSFLISGLAAQTGVEARTLLFRLALAHVGPKLEAEWKSPASKKRQPWLVRNMAIRALARSADPAIQDDAIALLSGQSPKGSKTIPPLLAQQVGACILAEREGPVPLPKIQALLTAPQPQARAAGLHLCANLGLVSTLDLVPKLLKKEPDLRLRNLAWRSLSGILSGDPKDLGTKASSRSAVLSLARRSLLSNSTPLEERLAICRTLFTAKPKELKAWIPALKALKEDSLSPRLAWWLEGIIERYKPNQRSRRKRRDRPRPSYSKGLPKLFGRPALGKNILILLDCSDALTGPWYPLDRSGKTTRPKATPKKTLGQAIGQEILRFIASLDPKQKFRLVCYGKKIRTFPKRGFAPASPAQQKKLETFIQALKGKGRANHSRTLLQRVLGIQMGAPLPLPSVSFVQTGPSCILWLPCSAPMDGKLQSMTAIRDLALPALEAGSIPVHIAYLADRRPLIRRTPFYQLTIASGISRVFRQIAEKALGTYAIYLNPKGR